MNEQGVAGSGDKAAALPAAAIAKKPSIFRYSIEECDVSDRASLAAYREKLETWTEYFEGDPDASLAGQFGDMMWFDVAWRSANHARQFAKEDGSNASVAPLIAMMLDRGFVAGQVIAITRLLEKPPANQPKKGVISLPRIVDEMRAARPLITRENFVCHDALPYDYEALQAAELERLAAEFEANPDMVRRVNFSMTGPEGFDQSRMDHELFDQLSGVAPEARTRGDLIAEAFFDRLDELLADDLLGEIKALRNKSIAHAADAFSRAQVPGLRSGISLNDFDRAHYLLFAVFQTLSVVLFGKWRASPVPVPQHNMFEHLTDAFLAEKRLGDMQEFWKAHSGEREDWMTRAYHEVIPDKAIAKEARPTGGA
jgi:hypothetical protein